VNEGVTQAVSSYLLIIADRHALVWIISNEEMAFSERGSRTARSLAPGDNLLLYTTRGCFGNPARDQGRVIGHATVDSIVSWLDKPVSFGDRIFPIGCSLKLHGLAPFGAGVELNKYVHDIHAFPNPAFWSAYLRRTLVALDDHDRDLLMERLREVMGEPVEAAAEYAARAARGFPMF
jgi:hypothetical protein